MTGYRRARRDLFFFAAFLVLALVLTLPLLLQFTTHVAGDGSDDPALAWNLWWVPHALINLGSNPIYTDYLFYPIGLNLAFYTLTYLNAFLSIPIQYVAGIVPAANINLWLSFALSGFGAFLLARHLLEGIREGAADDTHVDLAAFAAGLVYAFSSNKFLYASLGQFNIASSQWIPFYVLYLVKLLPPGTARSSEPVERRRLVRDGLVLGVFLVLQAASELIFASFLVLFTLAYLVYWFLANRRDRRQLRDRLIGLALAAAVFVIPLSPVLTAMVSDLRTEGDFIQSGLGFSNSFSADLLGFFVPSHLHPLLGGLDSYFHFAYINFAYLGFVALALALVALALVPRARIWGLWLGLTFLITLGPTLRVNGAEYNLPLLPFNLLLQIPIVKGNRYPSRWSVLLTLFLAMLVAYGLYALSTRLARRTRAARIVRPEYAVTVLACTLILFEHLSVIPTTDFRIPSVYAAIAQDPGDYAVMELPLTWRNGFRVTGSYRADSQGPIDREFMLAQWYQSAHGHPILNGNTSRNPEFKFQYFAEAPVLDSLIAIQTGHTIDEATRSRDRALAPRVLAFLGVRYIVWHTPYEQANRDVAARTRDYIEQVFPVSKVAETYENGKGTALYRVADAPAADSFTIRPDDPLARLEFGDGWSAVGQGRIRLQGEGAQVFFPLAQPRDLRITIPFPAGSTGAQGATVRINGHELTAAGSESSGALVRDVPARYLRSGVNEVTFQNLDFREIIPPDLSSTRFPIGSTGGSSPAQIVVRSAGEEQGDFGHIYVRGIDESPGGTGYNVVVIDPNSGKVELRANFNTFASEGESARLAQFIDAVPVGRIVAVAARDEASAHLTEEAVAALRSIGAAEDLRGKFRWSHAVIGVKGAAPGTALEAASETRVSQLIVGIGATSPAYGLEIGEIRIEGR